MAFENLSEREKKILACLISHYVTSADPVGSRAIANKFRLGISPATIRNTMQDLEDMGLVQQPHTSAGRIPTDAGYRLYVDYLLRREQLSETDKLAIDGTMTGLSGGINAILDQTTRVLAELSNQLGIGISPHMDNSILSQIELIHMSESKILVVLVFKSGLAKTILVEVDVKIGPFDLQELSQVLNEKLAGLTLGHVRKTVRERLADTGGNPRLLRLFLDQESDVWQVQSAQDMYYGGTENIIKKPEFANRDTLKGVMSMIERRTGLIELLRDSQDSGSGLVITIGAENRAREIQSCSVVTANYKAGTTTGTIGVIGPTRMPYGRLVSLVKYAARQLSKVLKSD
jgi:heat-inducible transcriptional repressor